MRICPDQQVGDADLLVSENLVELGTSFCSASASVTEVR